eukprot:scaffold26653_cov153-Skeletonema_menzelii.AAC.11
MSSEYTTWWRFGRSECRESMQQYCEDLDRNERVGRNFRFFLPIEAEAVDIVTREDLRNSQIINSTNALPARTETWRGQQFVGS